MGLFKNKTRSDRTSAEPQAGAAAETERATSDGGRTSPLQKYPRVANLRAVVTHAALWSIVGLAALGGVGFIWHLATPPAEVAAVPEEAHETDPLEQPVGAYALSYTTAWLSASRDDAAQLQSFVQLQSTNELSAEPWAYADATVVSVDAADDGLYAVVVTAWVQETKPGENDDDDPTSSWVLRGFQSMILTTDEGMVPVGFPAPVAVQSQSLAAQLDYPEQLMVTDAAGATVQSFFESYAAGGGDLDRLTAPAAEIDAITPAPFQEVTVRSLYASAEVSESPADGDTVDIYADVLLIAADGKSVPATYLLTLEARAGRWEVLTLTTQPHLATAVDHHNHPDETPAPTEPESDPEPSTPTSTP